MATTHGSRGDLTMLDTRPSGHDAASAWMERTPDAAAVDDAVAPLTYRQLCARADRVARLLRQRGVGPETRVGVCMGRSAEAVVALLAVLRAGGAYVALDPAYPAERLAWMVADSGVRLVLADGDGGAVLPAGVPLVRMADAETDAAAEERGVPERGADPDSLAYVIYTSGSTGRPKGVGITHRGLANTLAAQGSALALAPGDRVLRFASPGFDASVWEVLGALSAGATLVVAPDDALLPGAALASLLRERRVTVATLPPSALAVLPEAGLPGLRVVVSAGEACTPEIVARWAPGRRFVNAYGPTETSICATLAECAAEGGTPPIGTAIAGAAAWVVDDAGRPANAGELLVGGAGVGRGYLGAPALTAAAFVPDPFSGEAGARLYRTGDRVRRRADGTLEFLGRRDDQVKVRGYRVEPAEVEAALAGHRAVAQAAVVARDDAPGGRLVAYLVAAPGSALPAPEELRAWAAHTLPPHLVPSAFVALEAFPLTPHGKTDRGALPPPPRVRPALAAPFRAPATEAERAVVAAWAEVLGVDEVGADDAFTALGGTSLGATRVVARLHARWGTLLPEAALLGHATVADVAGALPARAAAATPPLARVPRGGDLPLAFSQERVWFLTRLAPDNRSYHANAVLRFHGALDVPALQAGLRVAVARHEAFRTTFHEVDGRPVQRIHPAWPVHLPVHDLSAATPAERDAWVERCIGDARFDLAELPLVLWTLVRTGEDEHLLVHVEHHIIHDGWSFNLLLRDVAEGYRAHREGRAPRLPPLPVQFADFCVWQRAWMESPAGRAEVGFWRERLAASPPVLQLPTDRPRPPEQSFRGAAPRFAIPAALWARVRALAAGEGATPFMVAFAAFATLLSRWSGEEELCVGTAAAARRRHDTEEVAGMFVNALVLRADLSGGPSFRALLARVRRETGEAYAHQDVPFDAVVEALKPPRTLGHNPVFQVMFSFHDSALPELRLPGVEVDARVGVANGSAKFDMNLVVVPPTAEGAEATVIWEHATDLWDTATVTRMAGQLLRLLDAATADPDLPVFRLPLATDDERRLVLRVGVGAAPAGAAPLVHHAVAAQAARTPGRTAVSAGERRLTYAELDEASTRLARRLRRHGVGPEVRVAVAVERGVEMTVALLAVLRAGGAYVPVDPAHPAERLALVLEDCGAAVLLTEPALRDALPPYAATVVSLSGQEEAEEDDEGSGAPLADAAPENAAYVLYTSGSTGRPKGVVVPHAALANFLASMAQRPGMGADDVLLAVTTLSFDIAALELFLPLVVGGRVEVASRAVASDARALACAMEACGATLMQATPATWHMLVGEGWRPAAGFRALCGGEALPVELAAALAERCAEVWNLYGPTETTVWSAVARVDGTPPVPLGEPVAHTRLYGVDARLEPVPPGVPGELLIGGAGVARGYLGRAALTAERFVPDPFSEVAGARMYRTGDRVRRRADGVLEYLGRTDFQVKVRGFRIEPGEVEAALCTHRAVAEAVVVAHGDGPGERRLVAYVAAAPGAARPTPAELRAHMGARLPDYMVPAAVVVLDRLPRTPSGKTDRRALPAPGDADLARAPFAAPATAAERTLAAVWGEVLGVERVGVDDNYFHLGGDSIRAVQVVARARRRGVALSVADVFRRQTVRELARGAGGGDPAAPLRTAPLSLVDEEARGGLPDDVEDAYPLTRLQLGMLFHAEHEPGSSLYLNVHGYRVRAPFREAALWRVLAGLAERHPVLRTAFRLGGGGDPLQLVHRRAEIPLAVADLAALSAEGREAALDAWMAAERRHRFDPTRAPLLRCTVHRLGDEAFQLSLTEHHAILDGWSVASLVAEVMAGYEAALAGGQDDAEPPVATFRDFVALERDALAQPEARDFWRRRMDGGEPTRLAGARRADDAVAAAPVRPVPVPAEMRAGLERLAAAAGVPLRSVLLAAHLRVLAVFGGSDDVTTGLVASARPEDEGGERALGLFLNTLPLRAILAGGTWVELARQAFDAERDVLPFRRFPLSEIQQIAGRRPLFEAAFSFNHFHVLAGAGGVPFEGNRFFQRTELPLVTTFSLAPGDGGLGLRLEWDPRVLSHERVESMAAAYARVLGEMVASPGGRHDAVPLMDDDAHRLVVADWNDTARPYPTDTTVHEVFEAVARRTPTAVALAWDGGEMSYAELDARADRLARRLRAAGVGPECRVGVAVPRSAGLVVALLGVLKAGGAYVPIDAALPAERRAWMRGDAGVRVVVAGGADGGAGDAEQAHVLRIDGNGGDGEDVDVQPDGDGEAPERGFADASSLAYVLYTSGSTGRPKGVAVEHRAVLRLVLGGGFARFGADETWLQMAPAGFDASTLEIWGALLHGGRLALAPAETPGLDELGAFVRRHGVTSAWLTAGLFHALADAAPHALRGVRQLLAGGDVLSPPHVRRVLDACAGLRLVNGYGPTENTVFTCCHPVDEADGVSPVPIGRPVGNTRVFVLDAVGRPVPPGAPGELYAAGDGVARGYLGRAALTAERFVPDPFSGVAGSRLYRTGDRVRWNEAGAVEFLGRLDAQVKVRGFRVEPGEVEAALLRHPGVREAAVAVVGDGAARRLEAFMVARDGAATAAAEVLTAVRAWLPGHMVPAAVTALPALPTDPNGKTDRRALAHLALAGGADDARTGDDEPRTATERAMATLWSAVLRRDRVGSRDDFFALGGNSLQAMLLMADVRERFGVGLPLAALFAAPTVEALSRQVDAGEVAPEAALVPVPRVARRGVGSGVPVTPAE